MSEPRNSSKGGSTDSNPGVVMDLQEANAKYLLPAEQQVPKGYKQTEVGVIPEDWSLVELKQIVENKRIPSGVYKDKNLYGRGTQIIKLGDVFGHDFFMPDLAQRVELSSEEVTNYRVKLGDIIIALASVKLEGVGKVMLVSALSENTAYDHNVALIRLIYSVEQKYIFYLFKSNIVRNFIGSHATQVGTTFLKTSTILEFQLPIPPTKAEQEAIAKTLSDADALIEALEQLVAKKGQLKQGAMQELLTGKRRLPGFSGDWEVKQLGDVADVIDPHPSHRAPDEFSNGVPFVGIGDLDESGNIIGRKVRRVSPSVLEEHAFRYDLKDELIGLGRVASIGKVISLKNLGEGYAISPTLGIIRGKEAMPCYLLYTLKSIFVTQQFVKIMSGSTRSSVGMEVLRELQILIPSTKLEQTAIAQILSDMDAEISELECKLSKARAVKQGMMQQLLTGKIRLVVNPKPIIDNAYERDGPIES